MLNIGLASEVITPAFGTGLSGYFNYRPAAGVYDDVFVRAMAMEKDGKYTGFLVFDLCYLKNNFFETLKIELAGAGIDFVDDIIISATHSHTAQIVELWDCEGWPERFNNAEAASYSATIQAAVRAMKRALLSMAPAELLYAEGDENPYAFVRRYFMKNGAVVTNPSRCNPDVVKPETDFDRHIRVLAVKQYGRISALMVNIVNHCDTVGGDLVSADWPGRMTEEICCGLKADIPVFCLTDASGDINHFIVDKDIDQTNYAEANRIGRGYGKIVLGLLDKLEPVEEGEIGVSHATFTVPHRQIPEDDYAAAQKYLKDTENAAATGGDLTSEGLANGDVTVLRYFAQRVLDCHDKSTPSHQCSTTRVNLGKALAFITLPGEPFNGIAGAVRKASPYKINLVISLAQSESGYVPMRECFERGGYEVQPGINTVAPEASDVMIEAVVKNL